MEEQQAGVILIDKPMEWTSFDVVKKLRYTSNAKKIGHAGTLDPLATGLLIICFGKFTKRIEEFQNQEKEYTGTITLGATTPSFDLETEIDARYETEHITNELIHETAVKFTGEIVQYPPAHSAVKIDGKRAYEYARAGKDVKLKQRNVVIHAFEITRIAMPEIDFRIVCSKGTYIRSMANDFGLALKSGGYLSKLRRTRIGSFSVEDAQAPTVSKEAFYNCAFDSI